MRIIVTSRERPQGAGGPDIYVHLDRRADVFVAWRAVGGIPVAPPGAATRPRSDSAVV
jgi:hypothetical protein